MSLAKEGKKIASKAASKLVQDVIRERDETLSRPGGPISKKDDPIEALVRIAAAGIGLVSEAIHYRREKNISKEAYAPVLSDIGIDQETFLDFIDTFNKALEPNPWLYAINLAGLGGLAVPDPLMMMLGVGVEIATDAVMEVQSRFKSNKFLDSVNAEFFIPRGLICLVVTWRPDTGDDELISAVNFEGRAIEPYSETGLVDKMRDIITKKVSSGESLRRIQEQMQEMMKPFDGDFGCAEPAPLIFHSLHGKTIAEGGNGDYKKKSAVDRAEIWLDEHMDKRAQTKWIEKSPGLSMANMLPKPKFRSRYADPSHPASSGDIVAFLTGGHWQYGHGKPADSGSRNDSQRGGNDETSEQTEENGKPPSSKSRGNEVKASGLMSLLQKEVLYLVIVSLPSQDNSSI
ncbi:hypothetical protein G7Z17_g365 [Cylindrodendrum hubeiense]|uniref:Uncharacterized protein n=1 Tax=Cylindrodendrum hubeiense TaxID=595255 RepID=A0A9P5LL30_9HYPO|nr:hypothetical protein G7Z17_g365 [Cylindrodendrum hubeiense]